jgi:hypothetical protein
MKKLTKSQLAKVSKNLDNCFNNATADHIENGLLWYDQANDFCQEQSKIFNVSTFTVASIVSALSPRNKWKTNLKDTLTVLNAVYDGLHPLDVKVSTFHTNKFKAFALAEGSIYITNESRKTYSFVCNVGNLDPNRVTVDVWHLRACFNKTCGSIGKLAYDQIEKLTISKAKKAGLKGYQYQAIIWNSIQSTFINL